MKHIGLSVALLLGSLSASTVAFAQMPAPQTQQDGRSGHDPHRAAMHLGRKLGLTPDQTAKVEPILAQHQQAIDAIRSDGSLSPEQQHTRMQGSNRDFRQQLAGVLTQDQMQRWKEMRKQHKQGSDVPTGV